MKNKEIISVMKRYELKFVLTSEQLSLFKSRISEFMKVDKYGLTTIASLYYDEPKFSLINKSIEKPKFKEKIRLRSYGLASEDSEVFLEIKRKLDGIVYKRRICTTEEEVNNYLFKDGEFGEEQISRELVSFKESHPNLEPKYLIIYDRTAYYQDNSDVRITIDLNPRFRVNNLNLHTSMEGTPLLKNGGAILEVKVQHSIPLWLSKILTELKIYINSFSKVGEAHKIELQHYMLEKENIIENLYQFNENKGELKYGYII